jgi:hypothetical protein
MSYSALRPISPIMQPARSPARSISINSHKLSAKLGKNKASVSE